MLIAEAISRAQQDIGVSSDDTILGKRYIYSQLKTVRSELLRQEVEKKGIWPGFPMQTLRRFCMKNIDMAEAIGFSANVPGFKSAISLPTIVDTKEGKIMGGVFLPTMQRIDVISFTQWINNTKRRFRSDSVFAFLRDENIYIINYPIYTEELLIDIDAVYDNPEEVERINGESCGSITSCVYYPDLEFHLPTYLEGRFFRIVRQELSIKLGIPLDDRNNGKSDQTVALNNKQNVENTS